MQQLYKGEEISPLLHPINARDWIAMGWSTTPPTTEPEGAGDPDPSPTIPDALSLINTAESSVEIEALPGIGESSALIIFNSRPQEGYASLAAVAELPGLFSGIKWAAVAQWSAES